MTATMPAVCEDCRRPLRDSRVTLAQRPGTVSFAGKGVCVSCRKRRLMPKECGACGEPMRGSRDSEADYPGTVRHIAHGLCRACYDAERHGRAAIDAISPAQHARTMAGYNAWLAERRKRGVPEGGLGNHDDGEPCLVELAAWPNKTASQRRYLAARLAELEAERMVPA